MVQFMGSDDWDDWEEHFIPETFQIISQEEHEAEQEEIVAEINEDDIDIEIVQIEDPVFGRMTTVVI